MAVATYLIDGVALDDPATRWRLERATRLPATANRRVSQLGLPFRDGAIGIRQGMDVGQVGLSVAVLDRDMAGGLWDLAVMDDRRAAIAAMLAGAKTVTWQPGTGRSRKADVIESVVAEPELVGRRGLILSAALTVQPFWSESAPILSASRPLVAGPVTFPEFAGCTGKLADAIIRISGPFTGLTLTAGVTGVSTTYSLAAGTYFYINTATFRAWTGSLPTSWSPLTLRPIDYPIGGPIQLWPTLAGDPLNMPVSLTVEGTGFTADSTIAIRSRRWFL